MIKWIKNLFKKCEPKKSVLKHEVSPGIHVNEEKIYCKQTEDFDVVDLNKEAATIAMVAGIVENIVTNAVSDISINSFEGEGGDSGGAGASGDY